MSGHKSELERSKRLYNALGLQDCSGVDDVKKAYRELALLHHPDKNQDDPDAAERFKEVNTAYQVLSNADKKKSYDKSLSAPSSMFARSASGNPNAGGGGGQTPRGRFTERFTESNLQEELNQFRASRRAASASFRESCAQQQTSGRQSQYTAEQQEAFKQREKERETEMKKRLEKEREARREADAERARRLQAEKDKEEERRRLRREKLQRDTVERVFDDKPQARPTRAASGSFTGRTPPPPATAGDVPGSGTFGSSPLPGGGRSGEFDRSADEALQVQRTQVERQRRERDRQEEVRRKEQERFLERKLQEVRQREEEKQRLRDSEEANRFATRFSNLQHEEEQERYNSLHPEESHERTMILASLRNIVALYNFSIAVRMLTSDELQGRHYLSADEIVSRTLLRCGANEDATRAGILRERRHELERLTVVMDRELGLIKSHEAQRIVMARQERSHRGNVENYRKQFMDRVEFEFLESKIRIFLFGQFDYGIRALSDSLFQALRRSVVDDELMVVRARVETQERNYRRMIIVERRCLGDRTQLELTQEESFLAIVKRRASGQAAMQRTKETSLECLVAELQKMRADDREEKNKMTLELSRLNGQLHASHGENEVLHSAHKLALDQVEASDRKLNKVMHEQGLDPIPFDLGEQDSSRPVVHEQGLDPIPFDSSRPDPEEFAALQRQLEEKEDEIRALKVKCQKIQDENQRASVKAEENTKAKIAAASAASAAINSSNGEGKELVSLLCAENRRLLETNAKLTEELKMVRQSTTPLKSGAVGAAAWSSPQSTTTLAAAQSGGGGGGTYTVPSFSPADSHTQPPHYHHQGVGAGSPGPLTSTRSPANRSKLWSDNPPSLAPVVANSGGGSSSTGGGGGYASSSSYFSSPKQTTPPDLKQRAAAAIGGATAQTLASQRSSQRGTTQHSAPPGFAPTHHQGSSGNGSSTPVSYHTGLTL